MERLNKILKWCAIVPALAGFWVVVVTVVHFQDKVEFVLSTVTEEAVHQYKMDKAKLHYLWTEAGGD